MRREKKQNTMITNRRKIYLSKYANRNYGKKTKTKKEKIILAAANKELHFDWIMRSPNDRHSTGAFSSLIDGIHPNSTGHICLAYETEKK